MTIITLSRKVKNIIAVIALLLVWQLAAVLLNEALLLASPIEVIQKLFTLILEPEFISTVLYSFIRIAGGFVIAFFLGILLAVLAGKHEWVEIILAPIMLTVKSVPVASFIILALVWLTSGQLSVFISFLMVLPVIYNNVLAGIKAIDKKMIEMAEVYDVPWKKRFKYIWMPSLKTYVISGATIALGLAWKAGIAAEVIGIPSGSIGERLYDAKLYLDTAELFAWTVVIVLLSIGFEKLVLWLLKKFYERYYR